MDLVRHLRFFVTVAQERHFGQAAFALGMTQPPLSQGIMRLEKHLGVRLFERGARGVTVTAAGEWLLPMAEDLVRRADGFVSEAAAWSGPPALRVGVAADFEEASGAIFAAVSGLASDVRPTIAGSVDLVDRLRTGELDVAVVRHPGVVDGLAAGAVHTLPRVARAGTGNLRDAAAVGRSDLPVAVPPRRWQPAAHDQLVDSLRRIGHSGDVVEAADVLERRALVSAGSALRLELLASAPRSPSDRPRSRTGRRGLAELTLRVRVVLPATADRQAGLDHDATQAAIETALAEMAAEP